MIILNKPQLSILRQKAKTQENKQIFQFLFSLSLISFIVKKIQYSLRIILIESFSTFCFTMRNG